jgi:transposase
MFLHQLHQSSPDKKLVIILDNGSIHKSKNVQKFISKHEWVELFYLPPYSPEYIPIERFWHWLKQKVYGCKSFTRMDELIQQIRKLIWHYHEGRTISKINFNYEAYADLR